ncbi:type Iii polyketide Synthase [Mycena sp. CBHHK59/15]|nr:type Iii polyketide Synthase [Mycena sp. CBHHK59/15]
MSTPTLKIAGLAVAYPPNLVPSEDLDKLAYRWHKPSPALDKVLAINREQGLKPPFMDQPTPPTIKEITELFLKDGVALAISASHSAIREAGLAFDEITHIVATTCTASWNPGFDCCAGGLAGLQLAANLCQAAWRGQPAHVLLVACEITSPMCRSELERISRDQEVRVGITLFGDGASALILSLDYGSTPGIYELVNWTHLTAPDTYSDIRMDMDATGFKPTLSACIPTLTAPCTPLIYDTLLKTLSTPSVFPNLPTNPADFDWAMHLGGATILSTAQKAMQLDKDHMKASWQVYENHGNTSSVSVLSVLHTLRGQPGREWVVSVAFGPGVTAEGVLLRRLNQ